MGKIILYIATSVDGFIARKNHSVDWLDAYDNTGEDYGYKELYDSVGAVIVGNTTHKAFPQSYEGKQAFVFSRKETGEKDNITYVNEDVREFVKRLKTDAWLIGGTALLNEFVKHDLIDEYIITVIPILLGEGIPLFTGDNPEHKLKLLTSTSYKAGVVQLHYAKE